MKKQIDIDQAAQVLAPLERGPNVFRPDSQRITAFGIAAALAVGVGMANLRFPWWPLHPVMFVFLGGFQAQWIWLSALLGWGIKTAVLQFGGGSAYQRVKPVMNGLIAGDVIGYLIPLTVGSAYYLATGTRLLPNA